ncbi:MAG TPA: universal stress protein [Steroidobacteraceae bacterium]
MQRLDRILAVIDPTVEIQDGVAKAARLARASGAALELFVCDFDPGLTGEPFFDTDALRKLREQFIAERRADLDKLAGELRQGGGLEVTTHVHWDNPLHAGILRRVREFAPDLVVKDTHHHSVLRRTLFTNTDWTLIRKCPVPLLLAKREWRAQPRIVAALDPGHHADKPAALDGDILDAARLLARTLGGSVEALHAFFPAALLAATTGMAGMPLAPDVIATDVIEVERSRVTQAVHALAATRGLAPEDVRVLQGSAVELLPRHAEEVGADLVVMGAVARTRLQEIFIGSTAERVLDRLPCDVLVVKPGDFRERLPF